MAVRHMRPKITVLGSGELARATAQRLSEPATFEIFVYDRSAGAADLICWKTPEPVIEWVTPRWSIP
jgi:saccharopine dehydrogenase-like NADP-dependent oxidoreductase